MKNAIDSQPVLLFDGHCNLCNGSVQEVIKRDPEGKISFAALQSKVGKDLLDQFDARQADLYSVILINDNKIYERSDAVLEIGKIVGGLGSLLYFFRWIPKFIRDGIYNFIAKNRYAWFGKSESCMMPVTDLRRRFLDWGEN